MTDPGGPVIDAHGHLVPPALVRRLLTGPQVPGLSAQRVTREGRPDSVAVSFPREELGRPTPTFLTDIDAIVGWMDEQAIDLQVVGIWADLFGYTMSAEHGAYWHRLMNEAVLDECSTSKRFIPLATAALQDGRRAAAEVAWAAEAGFAGLTVGGSAADRELDDPDLEVFWEAAAAADLPVLIHPMYLAGESRYRGRGIVNSVGRPVDSAVALTRLVLNGTTTRYPGLRIVSVHGGGAFPYIFGRVLHNSHVSSVTGDREAMADPAAGLEALYFDTVLHDPRALEYLLDFAGEDKVVLGSDHPFPIGDPAPTEIVDKTRCAHDDALRRKVMGGTAAKLFLRR
jgi:aminocarboxymuconate-semialdehyde decarboxylase